VTGQSHKILNNHGGHWKKPTQAMTTRNFLSSERGCPAQIKESMAAQQGFKTGGAKKSSTW